MEEKLCPKCKKRPRHLNGSYCKECTKVYRHEWYEKHKETILAYQHQYRKDNPEKVRGQHKRYRVAHPDEVRKSQQRYIERHPEKQHEKSRKQYWSSHAKPVRCSISMRVKLWVQQLTDGSWLWWIANYTGTRSSQVFYDTELEAWDAGREALKALKTTVQDANQRIDPDKYMVKDRRLA